MARRAREYFQKSFVILLFFSLGIIFTNCQNTTNVNADGTVVIGIRADFDSLNELNAADTDALQVIQYFLFMPLTRLDRNLDFAPYLAEKWTFSEDRLQLTYFLRKDVYWTDGQKTTADDVVYTYQLAINPDIAYPAASRFDLIDTVCKIDDYTVLVQLKKAYPDVLFDMQIPILPKHILGNLAPDEVLTAPFNRQPTGNGPFKLGEWKANQRIVFEANEQHAIGRPKLDRVIFSIIPDENILLTNLRSGIIDLMPRMTPENITQIQQSDIVVQSFPGKIFTFIGWNLNRQMFTKPVRQAFTHAIDKTEIIETLLKGYGRPAIGPLTPLAWAFDEELQDIPFDNEKAERLLVQEGWIDSDDDGIRDKNGDPLNVTIKVNTASQLRQDVAILVQAQLKKIGVRVYIQRVEWNLFIQQVFRDADFDAVILAWDTDFTVNPTDLWHSSAIDNGYNFVAYKNARIDQLLELGRNAANREIAKPYWSEFQRIIIEDCPYTFLFIQDNIVAFNQRLQGCEFDLRSLYVNIYAWWTK
ncbi:hypothetical protein EH223_14085 [candidate division KSB1 bacterium]|nr:peptide-binding protein [candidate division KSB1 bacterium]RQW01820.1 MAG: hypothetical protein EH223_14085 [candidate division KSB1 bacterium]